MNSNLLNFIKTHKNWEELLSAPPYSLKISRDGGYIMFKYNQIESDFSIPEVREARGIIFREKDWKIVCRPFDKFFNMGEPNAAEINWNSPNLSITEKIDGSLIKLWHDNGRWHSSTNGTIDSTKSIANDALGLSFFNIFMRALIENNRSPGEFLDELERVSGSVSHNYTYMFEVVSPASRVVIPYENYGLFYLGARNNRTGEYEDFGLFEELRPRSFEFQGINALLKSARTLNWMHEGFVVFDGVDRLKVKSPAYVLAHYARNNGAISIRRLIDVILMGEEKEFLTYCSEYEEKLEEIKTIMSKACRRAENLKTIYSFFDYKDRKDFALTIKDEGIFKDFLFKAFPTFKLSWNEYIIEWTAADWEKFLEKYPTSKI